MTTPRPDGPVVLPGGAPSAPAAAVGPTCGATCGISRQRDAQKLAARALAARAFPGLGWTADPAWLPDEPPVSASELAVLAAALVAVLPARALVRPAGRAAADAVYLLAGLHAPCWLEARDDPGTSGRWPRDGAETYVRVVLSPLGRYYTLQEVAVTAARDRDGAWLEERRLAGIADRRLQLFVKATQGVARKHRLVGLDAAFLAEGVPDPTGASAATLGAPPTLWTLLFEPTPPGAACAELVPAVGSRSRARRLAGA